MSIFKRALVQVRANIGKSLLIFLIFAMTMGAISATFMVTRMYTKTINEVFKDGEVPIFIYKKQEESLFGNYTFSTEEDYIDITPKQYLEMTNFDTVASSETSVMMSLTNGQLEMMDGSEDYMIDINFTDDPTQIAKYYDESVYKFDYDKEQFNSDPNSVIINDKILAKNNLAVGDKITLDLTSDQVEADSNSELKNQEFTIVGSYSATPTQQMIDDEKAMAEEYGYEPDIDFAYLATNILMPRVKGDEVLAEYGDEQSALYVSAVYNLTSLADQAKFKEEAETYLGYEIETQYALDDEEDNNKAMSIDMLTNFKDILSRIIKFIVVVITVLLSVIITLFVRGRKKEIGILVALGESKRNIYMQLLIEQFIVFGVATLVVYPIVLVYLNIVMKKQASLTIGFDVIALGQSVLAGLLLVGIITIIPAIYTLRVKPKKILL